MISIKCAALLKRSKEGRPEKHDNLCQTQALSRLDWCQQWSTYHKLPTTIVTSLTLNTSFSSPGWLKCVQHAHSRKVMYKVRGLFSSSIYTLNMRNSLLSSNQRAFSQASPVLVAPFGCHPLPPVPLFLLTQNLSPKDIDEAESLTVHVRVIHW